MTYLAISSCASVRGFSTAADAMVEGGESQRKLVVGVRAMRCSGDWSRPIPCPSAKLSGMDDGGRGGVVCRCNGRAQNVVAVAESVGLTAEEKLMRRWGVVGRLSERSSNFWRPAKRQDSNT